MTREIQKFTKNELESCMIPLITIYKHPKDYPDKFVARLWDVDVPTSYIRVADTLDEIRTAIPEEMTFIPRFEHDDPVIVGAYV